MSKSGPDGPAKAVIEGKLQAAVESSRGRQESDFTPGDRLRKLDPQPKDTELFNKTPRAAERVLAAADPERPPKGPAEMPQEARDILSSDEVHSCNIPKRGPIQ